MPESPRTSRRSLLLGGAAALAVAACSGDDDSTAETTTTTSTTTTSSTTTTIDPALLAVAPLLGKEGPYKPNVGRSALVVKIDNTPEARPQFGIRSADIVVEERVESGISRLVAVFHSRTPGDVGPVRSTRSTDFDLIPLFGRPVYASSGGNDGVMAGLAGVDKIDVGHNRGGTGFRRVSRPAPHNLVADAETLYGRAGDAANTPPGPIFDYRGPNEALPATATPATEASIRMGSRTLTRYRWRAQRKNWARFHDQTPHESDGAQISPVNVVICEIGYQTGGAVGRSSPHGVTTGSGTAYVLTAGKVITGTWNRPSAADRFALTDANGTPIKLQPGSTFIQLPSGGSTTIT